MRVLTFLVILPAATLALGGGALAYLTSIAPRTSPEMEPRVHHLITDEMAADAEAARRQLAPRIETVDAYGKSLVLGGPGPQFVYFIKEGCPCSYDAEPFFKALEASYGKKVRFAAVTDGDLAAAKRWSTELSQPFPIASDPELRAMRAFGAKASVYSCLIDRKGRIVRLWPGFSKTLLTDINKTIAREAGEALRPLDLTFAPVEKATGCTFGVTAG
ncbi:MAG: hypothetical protein C4320_07750 [Armatimonadota bacterium]